MGKTIFEWNSEKDRANQEKHGVSFSYAQQAFLDKKRVIAEDLKHGHTEKRYFCFGKVDGDIITVRFAYRNNKIRIFGAGYWRKGVKAYEENN